MHRPRRDPWPAAPEFEHIAHFGGAEIVKGLSGRFILRAGREADQAEARAWGARFLSRPLHETREVRYTLIQRPERPKPPQRQWPTPRPRGPTRRRATDGSSGCAGKRGTVTSARLARGPSLRPKRESFAASVPDVRVFPHK
jgi:hypothetical protein